jgi:peptidoglycan hydrolase-like protein with peptidoglycan-binding domain
MTAVDVLADIAWSEGQVGFVEGPNNQNPYGPWQGISNAAYCCSFVNMGTVQYGGFRWPDNCQFGYKGQAYCPFLEADAKRLGIWHPKGDGYQPQPGDDRLYDWTGWGGADHVEKFWGYENGLPWNIGANTGSPNGVHYTQRDETYLRGTVALSALSGAAPSPSGPRELQLGFVGDDVLWLQSRLLELGYDVPGGADGEFGSGTWQAVLNFQHDWVPDEDHGIVGLVTREALSHDEHRADMHPIPEPPLAAYPPWPGVYLRRGMVEPSVKTFQLQLIHRGWLVVADGWFGSETQKVVRAFQTNKLLEVDGIVGPETWNAMWLEPIT